MKKFIRKHVRHCGIYGTRANYIQVSYFPYTTPKKSPRRRKFQASTPRQRELNSRNAQRELEALLSTNFDQGDLLLGLSYSDENMPEDAAGAKRKFHNFIVRLNRRRKKLGLDNARYIVVTEVSAKGRIHHHVIMDSDLDRDQLEEIWGQGYANTKRLKPDPQRGLLPVVGYIAKTFRVNDKNPQRSRRWDCSHNLKKPWDSINDDPRMMSKKKMRQMETLPEDCEEIKRIIEADNPCYKLISVEKEYCEDTGAWHYFCRMRLSQEYVKTERRRTKCRSMKSLISGEARAKPPPENTGR